MGPPDLGPNGPANVCVNGPPWSDSLMGPPNLGPDGLPNLCVDGLPWSGPWALMGCLIYALYFGPHGPGPNGPPWDLQGRALQCWALMGLPGLGPNGP